MSRVLCFTFCSSCSLNNHPIRCMLTPTHEQNERRTEQKKKKAENRTSLLPYNNNNDLDVNMD